MTASAAQMVTDAEAAIRRVIDRYFAAAERRDAEAFSSCFSHDAELTAAIGDGSTLRGRAAIASVLAVADGFASSIHLTGSVSVEVDGDRASAQTRAVAYLTAEREGGSVVARGLRYEDELIREGECWVIRRRRHHVEWQFEAPRVPPNLPERARTTSS